MIHLALTIAAFLFLAGIFLVLLNIAGAVVFATLEGLFAIPRNIAHSFKKENLRNDPGPLVIAVWVGGFLAYMAFQNVLPDFTAQQVYMFILRAFL